VDIFTFLDLLVRTILETIEQLFSFNLQVRKKLMLIILLTKLIFLRERSAFESTISIVRRDHNYSYKHITFV
jgi:hypothetical protein